MVGNDALEIGFVAYFGGVDQAQPVRATLHEKRKDLRVFKLVCNHMRRLGPAKTTDVDAATGLWGSSVR